VNESSLKVIGRMLSVVPQPTAAENCQSATTALEED
jgi:hypothetical protein